jgi:hypothetical protein
MLTSARIKTYGMPPGWEPAGKTKLKKVIRWRKGDLFVERSNGDWFWYSGIKTKYMHDNGAFKNHVACAVAAEIAMGGNTTPISGEIGRVERFNFITG